MKKTTLLQSNNLTIKGKVSYHESAGAFNTIRLKKELINKHPELKNKQNRIKFKIESYLKYYELKKRIIELELMKEKAPLLLFLYKEQ